ncbi:Rab-GAP/TBC domain protein [Cordyceps fumosorosea ARSEF 2679]|uniref:Rab-GAP/TBC domain protein n=1 Tax=Cordyceps fumosorosea (strain ARSEF 2679) TaxID=1081104 RepID=A0A167TRM5_CORFA|nr:Rab-GAP/TBC domain protein [Cordyceps fumosorosea ARSEF 2679]OAA60874.1 Rab-GAP/TBC domain protein [Cordyceps fumosorosea ARSEF 2679]
MSSTYAVATMLQSPDSPPGMTTSKSSKSSSFHSLTSDDGSVLADIGHFEDIGLDDEHGATPKASTQILTRRITSPSSNVPVPAAAGRTLAVSNRKAPAPRRSFPNLRNNVYSTNPRSTSTAALTDPRPITLKKGHSTTSLPHVHHQRSISPALPSPSRDVFYPPRPRRGSWQANNDRRSISELEQECDEDEGDDIPEGLVLDNVPLSPRPQHERPPSRIPSTSTSPERTTKERVRSIGNGTPAVAQAQGSLRSPTWKADAEKRPTSPTKTRAHSWNLAHAELNAEARALTEKLEEHADEVEEMQSRRPSTARPNTWAASQTQEYAYDRKERGKSSTPELPPLRRTDNMVDPLPISKEKEAVLSRTRPSWLPPKDPAEERRHVKQYQKMMAASIKADERREAARRAQTTHRDNNAETLMHLWEDDIIPRWNDAIRERRTRDMWWRGIAPRSRGAVWSKAIGNELGLSAASFRAALGRAQVVEQRIKEDRAEEGDEEKAKWFQEIRQAASDNTWTELRIFQEGGPLHTALVNVLSAYAMYRVDIGYVAGCNTIAALLLLNLPDSETAFVALANILNRSLPLSFQTSDATAQVSAYNLVLRTLSHKSATLHDHLTSGVPDLTPEVYLSGVFSSIFTSLLAIDEAARLWDVYVFEGDALLVRAAVAILMEREMDLLGSKTPDEVWAVMSKASTNSTAPRAVGEIGAEDRFIRAVRDAGKA